jgi:pilus assembly protein CpaF
VVAITEVQRMEADVITLQDLYKFEMDAVSQTNHIIGSLKPTGLRPGFLAKFEHRGIEFPNEAMGRPAPPMSLVGNGRG